MAGVKILIGPDRNSPIYEFDYMKGHIKDFSGIAASSLVGDELTIDTIRFTVDIEKYYRTLYSPTNYDAYQEAQDKLYAVRDDAGAVAQSIITLQYATIAWVYYDNTLFGKYYTGEIERTSYSNVVITIQSAMAILDKQQHLGGLYDGVSVANVISDIIGGAIPYTADAMLDGINVYNYLPIETKRDAIHQVVFAYGISILKDANGDLVFGFLDQTTAKRIPDNSIFLNGKSTHTPPATKIEVLEHSYFKKASDAVVILFDNSEDVVPAQSTFVAFQEAPVYDIAVTGLTLHSSSVNYAIVSGLGTITGKKYNHQTNRVSRSNANASGEEKLITSEGCTLVSMLNSSNVLRRLLSYYSSDQTFTIDLAVTSEKPGDQITFTSPFGDTVTAFLASMQITASTFMKARCSLVKDFVPLPPGGGDYSHVVVITKSGTWTPPAGVTMFTAVLIQGGSGGQGGQHGGNNGGLRAVELLLTDSNTNKIAGAYGYGGIGGSAGTPGKVYIVRIDVEPQTSFNLTIGAGGKGGAAGLKNGTLGGETSISGGGINYSSANGTVLPDGYYDVIEKKTYAVSGENGISGGDGGLGADYVTVGVQGGNVGEWVHGEMGSTTHESVELYGYSPDIESNSTMQEVYSNPDSKTSVSSNDQTQGYTTNTYNVANAYYTKRFSAGYVTNEANIIQRTITASDATLIISSRYNEQTGEFEQYYYPGKSGMVAIPFDGTSFDLIWYYHGTNPENPKVGSSFQHVYQKWTRRIRITKIHDGFIRYWGGEGGGAAYGSNGGDSTNNTGGKGGNASQKTNNNLYGSAGHGGNGGGGAGGYGGVSFYPGINKKNNARDSITIPECPAIEGGTASSGGDGKQGCAIIYY